MKQIAYYQSPLGVLIITSNNDFLTGLDFFDKPLPKQTDNTQGPIMQQCIQQLQEYFAQQRTTFDIPLQLSGTTFQKNAWQALQGIPYGQTISYQAQANMIGNSKAVRAIGHANSKNPIAIIIPCHRVVGKTGNLTGYAGQLWRKEWLLHHEHQLIMKN